MLNPFRRKKPNPKRKDPRRTVEERLHGQAKTDRRREIFERSGGYCEAEKMKPMSHRIFHGQSLTGAVRCNAPITFETMEWSHKDHAARKSDAMAGGIASCKECHQVGVHNPKPCKRRPGKVMSKKSAQEYWAGEVCSGCDDGAKKSGESFCPTCREKISPQTLHTLENTDDPDVYRETHAQAEIEILTYKPTTEAEA